MVFDSFKHSGRVCRCATSALLQKTCIKFLQDLHQLEQLPELSKFLMIMKLMVLPSTSYIRLCADYTDSDDCSDYQDEEENCLWTVKYGW